MDQRAIPSNRWSRNARPPSPSEVKSLESIVFRDAVASDIPALARSPCHDVECDVQHDPGTDDRDAHVAMEPSVREGESA